MTNLIPALCVGEWTTELCALLFEAAHNVVDYGNLCFPVKVKIPMKLLTLS